MYHFQNIMLYRWKRSADLEYPKNAYLATCGLAISHYNMYSTFFYTSSVFCPSLIIFITHSLCTTSLTYTICNRYQDIFDIKSIKIGRWKRFHIISSFLLKLDYFHFFLAINRPLFPSNEVIRRGGFAATASLLELIIYLYLILPFLLKKNLSCLLLGICRRLLSLYWPVRAHQYGQVG